MEEDPPPYDEALELGYDIIKSKDVSIELPLEIEVCSESSMSPPKSRGLFDFQYS